MVPNYPKDIIITTGPLGGLGDHAVYTTLPERFTKEGHNVYVDADNLCRNDEISDLLWGMNPYVLGSSDRKPNAGYINQGRFYDVANRFPIGAIEAMERAHGLPPPYSMAPRIYYTPNPFRVNLEQCVLLDYAAVSSSIGHQGLDEIQKKVNSRFPNRACYLVTFPDWVVRNKPPVDGPSIQMNSIYEYVDALASCYAWVGSEAGGQALAAAVRGEHDVYDLVARPEIVAVLSPKTYNSRGYTFRGVDYRVTVYGNVSGDYWEPHEVPYQAYQEMCRRSVEEVREAWKREKEEQEKASA